VRTWGDGGTPKNIMIGGGEGESRHAASKNIVTGHLRRGTEKEGKQLRPGKRKGGKRVDGIGL